MISQGHTMDEAFNVVYNLYHFGAPVSPDEISRLSPECGEPCLIAEEFMQFLKELVEKMTEKSVASSAS